MRRLVALGVLVIGVLAVLPTNATAANVVEVGWWTRSPAASAPDGGIDVANAPDGPLSVAAVRVDLGTSGVSSGTLSLPQAGGAAPNGAQLVACIVDAPWTKVAAGPIAEAPATTCDGTSAAVTANGELWTVDLGALIGTRTGTVAFAIVPSTGSASVFDLQFDAVSFQGTPASPPTTRSSTTPTTVRTAPSPASTPTFAAQPPPTFRLTTTTVAITPTTVNNFVANVAADSQPVRTSSGGVEKPNGRPIGQAISLALIAAIVGAIAGVGHKVVTARAAG